MNFKKKLLVGCLILACTMIPTKSIEAATEQGLDSVQRLFVDQYYPIAEEICTENNLPWEAVMAQGILESGSGQTRLARERNNLFGICAYDSDVNKAKYYESPEECWESYCRIITDSSRYADAANNYAADPYGYVVAVKAAGYATDPNYVSKLSSLISDIEAYALEMGYKSSETLQSELENERLREVQAREHVLTLKEIILSNGKNAVIMYHPVFRSIYWYYDNNDDIAFA